MHTMHVRGWFVHHNGDFSGEILFAPPGGNDHSIMYQIPYEVIEAVVADKIRSDRIAKLEQSKVEDLLK